MRLDHFLRICYLAVSSRCPEHGSPFGGCLFKTDQWTGTLQRCSDELRTVSISPLFHALVGCGRRCASVFHLGIGAFPVDTQMESQACASEQQFFYWSLAVSLDSQYCIVVELRANLRCVYRELIRRAITVAVMRPAHCIILATVLRGC